MCGYTLNVFMSLNIIMNNFYERNAYRVWWNTNPIYRPTNAIKWIKLKQAPWTCCSRFLRINTAVMMRYSLKPKLTVLAEIHTNI